MVQRRFWLLLQERLAPPGPAVRLGGLVAVPCTPVPPGAIFQSGTRPTQQPPRLALSIPPGWLLAVKGAQAICKSQQ